MTDGTNPPKPLNPWFPTTDMMALAILGKALEETGEATSALARCLIQGIDEKEPVTGKPNREWLEDELADNAATFAMVVRFFGLDEDRMTARADAKMGHLEAWHGMIRQQQAAVDAAPPPGLFLALSRPSPEGVDAVGEYLSGFFASLGNADTEFVRIHVEQALRGFVSLAEDAMKAHVAARLAAGGVIPASAAKVEADYPQPAADATVVQFPGKT